MAPFCARVALGLGLAALIPPSSCFLPPPALPLEATRASGVFHGQGLLRMSMGGASDGRGGGSGVMDQEVEEGSLGAPRYRPLSVSPAT
jgi:hypothetical protein